MAPPYESSVEKETIALAKFVANAVTILVLAEKN
jgi:hypothetical protein